MRQALEEKVKTNPERIIFARFIKKTTRENFYLSMGLGSERSLSLNTVYLNNIIILKHLDVVSIKITKHKSVRK